MATTLASPSVADRLDASQFYEFDPAKARIGQLLFYDKILSGNKNISCATCHHHDMAGTDSVSLGIGEGGVGLGPTRLSPEGLDKISARIPRNAPALWNIAHKDITNLFHDGRVAVSDKYAGGFDTPAKDLLPTGLDTIIAAQALFPMTSADEMAGGAHENPIGAAVAKRIDLGWAEITNRVRDIPAYTQMITAAYPEVNGPDDLTIVQIVNSIAAFIGSEWQSYDSVYDAYVTQGKPLQEEAERGRELFFGEAHCVACHNGPLFSDQQFHAMAIPQFGPGRTDKYDPVPRDVGRMFATSNLLDAYKFRTPSLRNVALTGPYGHNGAYSDLKDMIRHMADPVAMRASWTPDKATLPRVPWLQSTDFRVQSDALEMARQAAIVDTQPVHLSEQDIIDIEAFLNCLTGETAQSRPLGRPDSVPSGLPVD
ncbi:Cytochrome c551 peroxidase [Pseudoprimorskyibacter insulae]|uniref:Cytochrome c551 peroxidase n=2 Tax=Pseudoprimorskyibacter insulae TaxID=1695997 RepID=A0A2R8AV86_9RHOB|nr:Cytochrome c551 peroxidase [Pseudoprimorskyibacter insulae]